VALALGPLTACSDIPVSDGPREILDSQTGATISMVARPLVFAHERPERAAHMRDYITLAAAAVDRGGRIEYDLIAYFWTTFDAHGLEGETFQQRAAGLESKPLTIAADDRRILLQPAALNAREAGIGLAPDFAPPHAAMPVVYATDLPTLGFLSAARHLAVLADADDPASAFELWADQRRALKRLVRSLNGE
jgi:hypothetical protein